MDTAIIVALIGVAGSITVAVLNHFLSIKVKAQEVTVNKQERQIQEQRKIIDDLVIFSMAWFMFDLLKGIYYARKNGGEYLFHQNDHAENLLFLRNNGFIELQGIRQLQENTDLAKVVKLTPIGSSYVEIRENRDRELKAGQRDKSTDEAMAGQQFETTREAAAH